MNITEIILASLISGGGAGALTAGLINHFSNKRLDIHKRTMEMRKESYTKVNEFFSNFYSTSSEKNDENLTKILVLYREIQLWGSDEVVKNFQKLLKAMDIKNSITQEIRDLSYKEFVISMRKDILGMTDITPNEVEVHGVVTSSSK